MGDPFERWAAQEADYARIVARIDEAAARREARSTQVVGPDVNLVRASDVTPEPIEWLWDGWLAAGKLHILGGAPGTGKTTICVALAATVSSGGRWPDGTRSATGNVVIWSGEDDPRDTLVPRLALSGADLTRVYFIGGVQEGIERRAFDPASDVEPLRRKLVEIGDVKLLIVDPIVSAVAGDSNKNAETRRALQPLADLAASMRCAVQGVTHFSKNTAAREPVERLTGSVAFGALARVVTVAASHREPDGSRLFCRAKSNIGPDGGGFKYDLHQAELTAHPGIFASAVLWGNAVEGTARELLAEAEADDDERSQRDEIDGWLQDLLADGRVETLEVKAMAAQAGFSWRSVQRAATAAGVVKGREGFGRGAKYFWSLPPVSGMNNSHESAPPCVPKTPMRANPESVARMAHMAHMDDSTTGKVCRQCLGDGCKWCRNKPGL